MENDSTLGWSDGEKLIDASNTDIDNESLEEQKKERYKQNTHARRFLTYWVCIIVTFWLLFSIILTVMLYCPNKNIEPSVAITIFGTQTLNVLGLANIVLRSLFNSKNNV